MRKRFSIFSIFIVSVLFVVCGFILGCGSGDNDEQPKITGIYAPDVNVRYDGALHYASVYNTVDGDIVEYSASENGPWSAQNIGYEMPGTYTVYYAITRAGCDRWESSVKITITRGILSGISASDAVYIYDGRPHGIEVSGLFDGAVVMYSADGVSFFAELAFTAVGEYTVYYRVSDAYADFFDSCTLTVLPDISATYINKDKGIITLEGDRAFIDGVTHKVSYGIDGDGLIGESEFSVDGDALEIFGARYAKLGADEYVYAIAVGDGVRYAAAGEKAEMSIRFVDGSAHIYVNGVAISVTENANYCENVSCGEREEDYDGDGVNIALSAVGRVTRVAVSLSFRERLRIVVPPIFVIYDGKAHKTTLEFDGQVLYKTDGGYTSDAPSYTEAGEYSVEAVLLTDKYLPERVVLKMTIAPDICGIYYSATEVFEINGWDIKVNGIAEKLDFSDGYWMLDGAPVAPTVRGVVHNGTEYEKTGASEGLVLISFNGRSTVIKRTFSNLFVRVDGNAVTATTESGDTVFKADSSVTDITVEINGKRVTGIVDGESGETTFIIGTNDLKIGVVSYVVIAV